MILPGVTFGDAIPGFVRSVGFVTTVVSAAEILAHSQSFWSHRFGETELFFTPNMMDLYQNPRVSTCE